MINSDTNYVLHIKQKMDAKNIAVYNPKNNQEVFTNVLYIDGSATDDLKIMEHPKEDGAAIVDHIIDDAKQATIKFQIDDNDSTSLNEILDLYRSRTPLTVKIKNEIFTNLCISSKPVKAEVSHYNTSIYELSFKEVMEAQTTYVKMSVPQVKQKKNASTVKTGQKKAQSKPSVLRIAFNKITGRK